MNKLSGVSKNILVDRVPLIVDRIAKLNEKLKMSGAPQVEIEVGPQRLVKYSNSPDPSSTGTDLLMCDVYIKREINGPAGEVRLLAKTSVDPTSRFMSHQFYAKLDDDQIDLLENPLHPCHCDHCGTQRNRVVMFAFETVEGVFRVGSGCADDFAGLQIRKWTDAVARAIEEVEVAGRINTGDIIRNIVFRVEDFVKESVNIVNTMGYSSFKDYGSNSTGKLAFENLLLKTSNDTDLEKCYSPEVLDKAKRVIDYIIESEFRPDDRNSDYFINLRNLVSLGYMTTNQSSLLSSSVASYNNHEKKKELIERNMNSFSGHVGEVGQRTLFKGLVVESVYLDYESQFPSTKVSYLDENKNLLVWKRSGIHEDMAGVGEKVTLVGRVDAHNKWLSRKYEKEVCETKLTRCVIMEPEDVIIYEEKEEKKAQRLAKKKDREKERGVEMDI